MSHRTANCPELPAPPGRIVLFALIALISGTSLAVWIERPTGPECVGILAARTTYVTSQCEGTLASFGVEEGALVKIGDPLIEFSEASFERQLEAKQREVASLESELKRVQTAAQLDLAWRTRTLETEICDIQLKSASYLSEKFDYELQHNMMADLLSGQELVMLDGPDSLYESIAITGRVPKSTRMATVLELEAAANHAEVSAIQLEICELRQKQLEVLKQELPEQINQSMGVDVAAANLETARIELENMEAQREELIITSPAIGQVGVFKVRRGDHLKPGTQIVELLDDARRYLIVQVPSKEITHFNIGTAVALAFPGSESRTGQVYSIAPQAIPSSHGSETDAMVSVHVEETGRIWPAVPIGSQVRVRLEK